MGIFRLYADERGESRIETIALAKDAPWTKPMPAQSITFDIGPVGKFVDFHPAPRRQFIVIVSGQLEIGLSDGSKHVFSAGDIRLVEDTTGKGHTTAVLGNEPCITVVVPLATDTSI